MRPCTSCPRSALSPRPRAPVKAPHTRSASLPPLQLSAHRHGSRRHPSGMWSTRPLCPRIRHPSASSAPSLREAVRWRGALRARAAPPSSPSVRRCQCCRCSRCCTRASSQSSQARPAHARPRCQSAGRSRSSFAGRTVRARPRRLSVRSYGSCAACRFGPAPAQVARVARMVGRGSRPRSNSREAGRVGCRGTPRTRTQPGPWP